MSSTCLDGSSGDVTSDPILSTEVSDHACGSYCICVAQKSSMSQTRVITDESPSSHYNFKKMPYDVRREVYLLLLANRDIYFTFNYFPLSNKQNNSKSDCNVGSAQETEIGSFLELSPTYSFPTERSGIRPFKYLSIPLGILRVSRQIYHEARLLPYTHNLFHMDTTTLDYFIDGLAPYQKQSLRSLSLEI
jgi:hypothetical protein